MNLTEDRLLDRAEAAKIPGLKPQTLSIWAMSGRNLAVVKLGRRVKYRLSDVEKFVKENTMPAGR